MPFAPGVAKVAAARAASEDRPGRLVLVSAVTPTRSGAGKTVVSIGLAMALRALGRKALVCLRQPSLGPLYGRKGGASGGGRARVEPAERIDLHLTGDGHAVECAHNLLASFVEHHLDKGGSADGGVALDPRRVTWRRTLDQEDRALRLVVTGLGAKGGVPRQTGFEILGSSEVMAVLSLASGYADLRARLGRIVVGWDRAGAPVRAADLGAAGPMAALLRDAALPNLVQTSEGGPALVHGGPFANLSHGCSSVAATRLGLDLGADVVTEAGFGFDLGGEKALHLKFRQAGLWPRCVVLVTTLRALAASGAEAHGDEAAAGLAHLDHHLGAVAAFGLPAIVAINVFPDDGEEALARVEAHCRARGVPVARSFAFADGGAGALDLARAVIPLLDEQDAPAPRFLYALEAPLAEKLEALARTVYGARAIAIDPEARATLEHLERAGFGHLPICVAKSPHRLGPDATGTLRVASAELRAGAGYVVLRTPATEVMPALPPTPAALALDLLPDGTIVGLR